MKNVWFAGVHADVGGGYPDGESGLAKVAFAWMVREARRAGLLVDDAALNAELGMAPGKHGQRQAAADGTGPLHRSLRGLWWLFEWLPRRQWFPADGKLHWSWGPAQPRRMPDPPLVHQSVEERRKSVPAYRPVNLPATCVIEP